MVDIKGAKLLNFITLSNTMAVKITYFGHATTADNEKGISTGWEPGELSELGKKQILELKDKIKNQKFDIVFCSDLKRAVDSAKLAFGNSISIIQDKRLRECNYGDLTQADAKNVDSMKLKCINNPFPNGESYKDVEKRVSSFLSDLLKKYNEKHVAIFSHLGPLLAMEVLLKNKTWSQAIKEDQMEKKKHGILNPGWEYILK